MGNAVDATERVGCLVSLSDSFIRRSLGLGSSAETEIDSAVHISQETVSLKKDDSIEVVERLVFTVASKRWEFNGTGKGLM